PCLGGLVVEHPLLGVGSAGLHRSLGRLVDACEAHGVVRMRCDPVRIVALRVVAGPPPLSGPQGFEPRPPPPPPRGPPRSPATPCSQSRCATRLRHAPLRTGKPASRYTFRPGPARRRAPRA